MTLGSISRPLLGAFLVLLLAAPGCGLPEPVVGEASASDAPGPSERTLEARAKLPRGKPRDFGPAPALMTGALAEEVADAVDTAFGSNLEDGAWRQEHIDALRTIAKTHDPRLAWLLADLMRISADPGLSNLLGTVANDLLQVQLDARNPWSDLTDRLIAWKVPAPPGYLPVKRRIFTLVVPEWERIFQPGEIDWRLVTWGGVRIDDRPFGKTDRPCNCIPAADDPPVTDVAGAKWLRDSDVVFGIGIGDEFRAYPRRIMEVREMVNDTLGGRHLGIPYCTLCGSAQAYFTDRVPRGIKRPVLRTSGLLIRSNKVMYDLESHSVFDTFKGNAVTGDLARRRVVLPQASVVTTTWGEWKQAHPQTTVLTEGLALGRDFDFRNGRDAQGPIFPIGDADPRLPVQEDIVGAIAADGTPVAFHLASARAALERGERVEFKALRLVLDGGGVRVVGRGGRDVGSHQAFWFAWSQFHPTTLLWPEEGA